MSNRCLLLRLLTGQWQYTQTERRDFCCPLLLFFGQRKSFFLGGFSCVGIGEEWTWEFIDRLEEGGGGHKRLETLQLPSNTIIS